MKNKPVKFNTKLIHEGKVYLPLSDVVKALGYKRADFINEYSRLVEKISGVQCIRETDYNNLLAENESALSKQGQIEVTKIETLRSKIDCVLSFQPLKFALTRDYLQMMAARTGCESVEEYILVHEIQTEKQKALTELMQNKASNSSYRSMLEYLQDKERFDVDKVRSFGLDIQYLIGIDCSGKIDIDVYVVGRGVFYKVTDLGDNALWNDMYLDEKGDVILPWCNYDSVNVEERKINLSKVDIERDFSKYNVVENMIWCIENLEVTALEDYEYAVFAYYGDTIDFSMPIELLVKLVKPNAVDTIYTDRIFDVENGVYMTEFDKEKVFAEDYED